MKINSDKNNVYKIGEIIVMTDGCYSNYGIRAVCRVTKPFSWNAAVDKYRECFPIRLEIYQDWDKQTREVDKREITFESFFLTRFNCVEEIHWYEIDSFD